MKELGKLYQLYESGNVTLMLQLIKGLGYDEIEVFKKLIEKYEYYISENDYGFAFHYPELNELILSPPQTPENEIRIQESIYVVWFNHYDNRFLRIEDAIEFMIKCFENEGN